MAVNWNGVSPRIGLIWCRVTIRPTTWTVPGTCFESLPLTRAVPVIMPDGSHENGPPVNASGASPGSFHL